ncbi:hypothetical protein [Shimia sp. SDUM112013]|uniref:hypothetical protein n=1 Tax=Shimia sp. SDUM112013 TaxID=3136160 RepID=UPI0032F0097B
MLDCGTVVRHRCHNPLCCRPKHLIEGVLADNKRDDWDYWAKGVDRRLLSLWHGPSPRLRAHSIPP